MTSYLIENVRLFDGVKVHEKPSTVLVASGKIQSVGTERPKDVPDSTVVVDGTGRTLLPGLIDAHTHVFRGVEEVKGAIKAGVTTVFDMHNVPANAIYMKDLAQKLPELPEIFSTLHAATIDGGWPRAIVRRTNNDPIVLRSFFLSFTQWPLKI